MEPRNLGLLRAVGWERMPDGLAFSCETGGLASARVTVHAVAPRVVRVRITAGPLETAKGFTYVTGRPSPSAWSADAADGAVTLRTAHVVVEARLDPWQLAFMTPDGRLLTR